MKLKYSVTTIFFLLIILTLLTSCSDSIPKQEEAVEIVVPKPNIYGLFVDSLKVTEGVVQKNETLTDILLPHNVSLKRIYEVVNTAKSVDEFDVRKINSGRNYKIFSKVDSIETIQYFVYESNPIDYAIIDFRDSVISIKTGAKEVVVKERHAVGVIENSLYMTLKKQNISDLLALKMAEVYAWQIDFYRIQDGDNFRVIFEEKFIDDEFVGVGIIKAAHFQHWKEDFYAFYYEQNGNSEYFDEKGNSLRKAFLKSPLKFGRMTGTFSGGHDSLYFQSKAFGKVLKFIQENPSESEMKQKNEKLTMRFEGVRKVKRAIELLCNMTD